MIEIKNFLKKITEFNFENASEKEIEEMLPTLGMNDEYPEEMPSYLKNYMGYGIRLWQYPNQFSKLLCYLKGKKINSYLEIGVRYGGSFVLINELLKRYNNFVESHCVDIIPPSELLHVYQHEFVRERFYYHESNSQNPYLFKLICGIEFERLVKKIDLVFIDGCHSYTCVKQDYFTALMFGAKYIVFHDIVNHNTPGNKLVWDEIKTIHKKTIEFTEQYGLDKKYLGIGVVEVSPEDKIFPMFSSHYE